MTKSVGGRKRAAAAAQAHKAKKAKTAESSSDSDSDNEDKESDNPLQEEMDEAAIAKELMAPPKPRNSKKTLGKARQKKS